MKDQKSGPVCKYTVSEILGQSIDALIDRGPRFSIISDKDEEDAIVYKDNEEVVNLIGRR